MIKLRKAYVGVVLNLRMTYNIQTSFEIEGYFSIKVTPLSANLCLLEENEAFEIRDLIREAKSGWSHWFSEIREWREGDVDNERVTWLRCFGIPCQAWNYPFFEMLANTIEKYVCADDNTSKRDCMDLARFIVRTKCAVVLNETFNIPINDVTFRIKMTEDTHGPLCIMANNSVQKKDLQNQSLMSLGTSLTMRAKWIDFWSVP